MKKIRVFLMLGVIALSSPATAQETNPTNNPFAVEPTENAIATALQEDVRKWIPLNPNPVKEFSAHYTKKTAVVNDNNGEPVEMTYLLLSPMAEGTEDQKFPLVVVLHGTEGFAESAYYLLLESVRQAYPSYVVIPTLPRDMRWADPGRLSPKLHALPQVIQLLEKLKTEHPIDAARIYVNGCGMGGVGAYGAAQLYPDVFAASVPVGATWNPKETSNMHKTPIAAFHGTKDELYSHFNSSDTITMTQQQGGTAFFSLFENMKHECGSPTIYTPTLWDWLFSQKRK